MPLEPAFAADGRVSWNIAPSADDQAGRRYIVDFPISERATVERREIHDQWDAKPSQTVSAIFSAGSFEGKPYLTVTVETPKPGAAAFDISSLPGEPIAVGTASGRKRSISVTNEAVAIVVDGRRIDFAADNGANDWLVPAAEAFQLDGDMASLLLPETSGMKFIGAFSPTVPVRDGYDVWESSFGPTTYVSYRIGEDDVLSLATSMGQITGADSLFRWLDSRTEPATIAGYAGWLTELPDYDVTIMRWFVDGRSHELWVRGASEDTFAELVAAVRLASAEEWLKIQPITYT